MERSNISDVLSPHRDDLRQALYHDLMSSDWKEFVKITVEDIIEEKGAKHISVKEIVQMLGPQAIKAVPDDSREFIMQKAIDTMNKKHKESH